MLNTATAYSTHTVTSTGPFASEGGEQYPRDSQSKLRDILRDQSRREEQQQHHQHHQHHLFSTAVSPGLAPSLQRHDSASRKPATSPSPSATLTTSASVGYFAGNHSARSSSPSSKRDTGMPHSVTTSGLDKYAGSSASLTSHLHRERSSRHPNTDQLGAAPDITPASSTNLSRSQSTAGLSNGLDLKVVILGAQGVGKTSLVHRYTSGHFSASSVPSTIGASFLTKKLIVDDVKVRLQLWDTAGQERFRSMAPMYYRGSNAAVIVYDITNPSSFEDVRTWIDELRKNVQSDLVIHIVGSKVDLATHSRKVDLEEAREKIISWTSPRPAKTTLLPSTPVRSRSTFGALGRMSTSASIPNSTSSASTNGNSRLGGFGALSALGSKHSRLGQSSKEMEDETGEVEVNSSPSTSSSNGNGATQSAENSKPEQWDFIEVSEVSSKDNEGIEDVFISIATRLVERKEEMEALVQSRKDRNSVFLTDPRDDESQMEGGASWCCAT